MDITRHLKTRGPSASHVLILGARNVDETITIARRHHAHAGEGRPFVPLTWAGLPDVLIESEILGHVRDGFPGAFREKPGALEIAAGGTLVLLDGVETLPSSVTARLTRVLMTGRASRVGSLYATYAIDVSLVGTLRRPIDARADPALTRLCACFTILNAV